MRLFEKVFDKPRFPATFEVGDQIAFYWDPAQSWFAFWPHSPKIDDEMLHATAVVRQAAKEAGWNSLRAFALDEAGAHNLLDQAVYYYGLLKRRAPDLPTTTDIGGGIAMGQDEIVRLSPAVDYLQSSPLDRLHFARQPMRAAIELVRYENRRTHAGSQNLGTSAHDCRSAGD